MAASSTWLNATLAGTAGGTTLMTYGGLCNSTGPSTTGANDIGATRQSLTWASPASAVQATSNAQSWTIASAVTGIGWVSCYNASTSGTYQNDLVLSSTVSFSSAGTLSASTGALSLAAAQAA